MIRITFCNTNLQDEIKNACPPNTTKFECHLVLFENVNSLTAQKMIQSASVEFEELKSRPIEVGASCVFEQELVFPLYSDWLNLLYYKMYYEVHTKICEKWMPRIVACKVGHEWVQGHCLNVKNLQVNNLQFECLEQGNANSV